MIRELAAAVGLLTRLPIWRLVPEPPSDFARSVWAYPIVGAMIGLLGGVAFWLGARLGLSPALAACWTLAAMLLITGALHEDGLADTADGFGGGKTRERKLEIMRDSRIGSYGTLALILSLAIRASALASLATPGRALTALVIAGAFARAAMLVVLATTRPARNDGMAAGLASPPLDATALGLAVPLVLAVVLLPIRDLLPLAAISVATALAIRHLATRAIGGHTGDVLGATALVTECLLLSLLAIP